MNMSLITKTGPSSLQTNSDIIKRFMQMRSNNLAADISNELNLAGLDTGSMDVVS